MQSPVTYLKWSRSREITAIRDPSGRRECHFKPVVEERAIRQAGQGIVECELLGLLLAPFECRDAAPDANASNGRALLDFERDAEFRRLLLANGTHAGSADVLRAADAACF